MWGPRPSATSTRSPRAPSSISATVSWMRVRTIRFFSRASVVGADQTAWKRPGQHIEGDRRQNGPSDGAASWSGDPRLVGGHPGEGARPSAPPARRRQSGSPDRPHRTPEGAIGGIAGRLEVANHILACVVTLRAGLRLRSSRGFNGGRLHYAQQRGLDDIVDTQAAKGDAAGLTIIESTADAGVAWDLALGPGVPDCELAGMTLIQRSRPAQQREPCLSAPRATWQEHSCFTIAFGLPLPGPA